MIEDYVKCENCIYYNTNDTRCCFCSKHKHFELKDNLKVELLEIENAELKEKMGRADYRITELKMQIEKMKCCHNCKNCEINFTNDSGIKYGCKKLRHKSDDCILNDYYYWEIAE